MIFFLMALAFGVALAIAFLTGKKIENREKAQQLKLGKPLAWNNTRVHTAARDETGFFVGLMTASGTLFAALAGRLKKERRA